MTETVGPSVVNFHETGESSYRAETEGEFQTTYRVNVRVASHVPNGRPVAERGPPAGFFFSEPVLIEEDTVKGNSINVTVRQWGHTCTIKRDRIRHKSCRVRVTHMDCQAVIILYVIYCTVCYLTWELPC